MTLCGILEQGGDLMTDELLFQYKDDVLFVKHVLTKQPDPKDFSFQSHYHNMYEIYYFLRGDVDFVVEGGIYPLKRGMLLVTAQGQTHNILIQSEAEYERFVIMFDKSQIQPGVQKTIDAISNGQNCFVLSDRDAVWLETCFESIEQGDRYSLPSYDTAASVIHLILLKLCQYVQADKTKLPAGDDVVRKTVRYINDNLTGDCTLDALEKVTFRNKAYLNRKFKSVMGCTIWEYVMRRRILSAQQQLYLSKSVATAYAGSGFNDYSAFYRKYKEYIGVSPMEDLRRYK